MSLPKILTLLWGLALSVSVNAKTPVQAGETINVLWIGNSFTFYNDLPELFKNIAAQQGVTVENTRLLKGGEKFSGHLKNKGALDTIAMGGWDYVILQEFSSTPAYSTKFVAEDIYPYAETLDSLIHLSSPDAETVLYMTWGHKNGNIRQTPYPFDDNYTLMQDRIKTTYLDLAYELNAVCAPVGMAWETVRRQYPDIQLYKPDNFHPSLAGSWLAANTIFSTIFTKPYESAPPQGLPDNEAMILQKVAEETVFENAAIINLNLSN